MEKLVRNAGAAGTPTGRDVQKGAAIVDRVKGKCARKAALVGQSQRREKMVANTTKKWSI